MRYLLLLLLSITLSATDAQATTLQQLKQSSKTKVMKKNILFVVTSHDKKGSTQEPTGYYLSEVSHPWHVLHSAGYQIDFVSPQGGKAPVDGFDLTDPTKLSGEIRSIGVGKAMLQEFNLQATPLK